ncbi:Transmembrane protein 19 [Escovopsis weberi]|uniref:Transmembrane protein 19 n=1 Tax=Escovopsis weberi TaxID=150374 RepID=A0A0M8MY07_ESCWE|nr:Transmembrane protein 19 [Escovopsis weberi]
MRPLIAVPTTAALVVRAYRRKSLTTWGILAATATAIVHAYHPWNLPFALLIVFFLAGTRATHVKENVKATLTMHSAGSSGGEGPRTHIQVLANSLVASVLSVLHAYQLSARASKSHDPTCYPWGGDLLVVGIIANYAAVAADTFSSELGILSKSEPRLITSLTLRKVPRGTNGGVTLLGLGAGLLGSAIIVLASMFSLPMCTSPGNLLADGGRGRPWSGENRLLFAAAMTVWGALGSVLDSVLGAVFQRTVKDIRSGKVVEGEGGRRALVSAVSADQVAGGSTKRADAKASLSKGEGRVDLKSLDDSAVDAPSTESLAKFDPKNKHRKPSFGDERPSRVVENGLDWFDNNEVNFIMAATMSIGAMALAGWFWDVPMQSIIPAFT